MEEIAQDLFVTFEIKDTASAKNNLLKHQLMCLWMWDICWENAKESYWNPRA